MAKGKRPTRFGRMIKVRLVELDMQQSDLARALGISDAFMTYLIYGERRDDAWVARICEILNMMPPEEDGGLTG